MRVVARLCGLCAPGITWVQRFLTFTVIGNLVVCTRLVPVRLVDEGCCRGCVVYMLPGIGNLVVCTRLVPVRLVDESCCRGCVVCVLTGITWVKSFLTFTVNGNLVVCTRIVPARLCVFVSSLEKIENIRYAESLSVTSGPLIIKFVVPGL